MHPDAIDRLAASREPPEADQRASTADVEWVMRKVTAAGRLQRIPRNPQHRRIVLALVCLAMRRRYPYTEVEINDYLKSVLGGIDALVDHVTCRRYLVDTGFVKRDRAGARYLLNYPQVTSTLSEGAVKAFADWPVSRAERSRS